MSELKTLKSLFGERTYTIPDYQRGYIWDTQQLADFWEDLLNVKDTPHYMGVLSIKENENNTYEVIDGQQRLTTCIILIQSIIEFAEDNNFTKSNNKIIFSEYESDSVENIRSKYLYENNIATNKRKYKFQYICDKESSLYFNHVILKEPNTPELQRTLYTNKLENAQLFFRDKLNELYKNDNEIGIKNVYDKLVNKLKFNEFIIEKDFDINVAFESMNNRGKKLSILELLKNRLLFLTTIISDNKKDIIDTKLAIVEAWAEIYKQLGKNKDNNEELLDDDFLKTHWIFYWGYSRQKGNDFEEFLLKKQFVRKKVYESLKLSNLITKSDYNDPDDEDISYTGTTNPDNLTLAVINNYVSSLAGSACFWVDSFYPKTASRYINKQDIVELLDKFNRVNAGAHFRPLITVALQKYEENCLTKELLIKLLQTIERFVFIVFALNHFRRNSYDAKFYNYSKDLYHGYNNVTVEKIIDDMNTILKNDCFSTDGNIKTFFNEYIQDKFKTSDGYYAWDKIRYFLYEYEMSLTKNKIRNPRVKPEILLKDKDKTIEHIYPQNDTNTYWTSRFGELNEEQKAYYKNAIGNLLLLSQPINSVLQNDSFDEKKKAKISEDGKTTLRTGYMEGSYSEQEVAQEPEWTSKEIIKRSTKLIDFMEEHWNISFSKSCKDILTNPISSLQSIEN